MVYIKCWGKIILPGNYSWNGWEVDPETGVERFVAGIRWEAYTHLANCEEGRRSNGLTSVEVEAALREIEEEWREATEG